jgi:hypothetical protein
VTRIRAGAASGRRALASGISAAYGLLAFLINGFAPLAASLALTETAAVLIGRRDLRR